MGSSCLLCSHIACLSSAVQCFTQLPSCNVSVQAPSVGYRQRPLGDLAGACSSVPTVCVCPCLNQAAMCRTNPEAAQEAYGRQLRFLANVDPVDVARALNGLKQETTLVVVVSKTFTTSETMLNARTVRSGPSLACRNQHLPYSGIAVCSATCNRTMWITFLFLQVQNMPQRRVADSPARP